ncbi:MAG: hypothetical protein GC160_02850 [Acidobacteria bacterium]|nr:hypothetical protein [Acidobacteriota bacterium]
MKPLDNIPGNWKAPIGPYQQAPAEYGGQWWYVNPFTGAEPWKAFAPQPAVELPEGFREIFGDRPQAKDYIGRPQELATARGQWDQDLKYFVRAGLPEWITPHDQAAADQIFEAWDMGDAAYYEGRYGWMARFPQSDVPDFELAASMVVRYPHQAVALYQVEMLQHGDTPGQRHPFTPPQLFETAE